MYRLETKTGKVVKVLDELLMAPTSSSFGVGIKGIRVPNSHLAYRRHPLLYFTNRNILGVMPIEHNGTSRDFASVIAPIDHLGGFTFSRRDRTYVAQTGADFLSLVNQFSGSFPRWKTVYDTLANGTHSQLFGPTAVGFGHVGTDEDPHKKGWNNAYISTNGGTPLFHSMNDVSGSRSKSFESSPSLNMNPPLSRFLSPTNPPTTKSRNL